MPAMTVLFSTVSEKVVAFEFQVAHGDNVGRLNETTSEECGSYENDDSTARGKTEHSFLVCTCSLAKAGQAEDPYHHALHW